MDPHQSVKQDPGPRQCDADPHQGFTYLSITQMTKNLSTSSFNEDLSKDTNFTKIYLDGQYLLI